VSHAENAPHKTINNAAWHGKESDMAPATHEHGQSLTLQPLPACLAPTPAECARFLEEYREFFPTTRLPDAGEPVVLEGGHVNWLLILDENRPVTEENTLIMVAGCLGPEFCQGTDWGSAGAVDPDAAELDAEDADYLTAARRLLIDLANTTGA
jgi:hypothetical protein